MYILLAVIIIIILSVYLFLREAKFGKLPSGKTLDRIKLSPNYKNEQFQNLEFTPNLAEGASMLRVLQKFFFGKSKSNKPPHPLPSQKTDLLNLDPLKNVLVWFGHSSYFMQVDGKKILVDPVFQRSGFTHCFYYQELSGQ